MRLNLSVLRYLLYKSSLTSISNFNWYRFNNSRKGSSLMKTINVTSATSAFKLTNQSSLKKLYIGAAKSIHEYVQGPSDKDDTEDYDSESMQDAAYSAAERVLSQIASQIKSWLIKAAGYKGSTIDIDVDMDTGSHDIYGDVVISFPDGILSINFDMDGNYKGFLSFVVSLNDKDQNLIGKEYEIENKPIKTADKVFDSLDKILSSVLTLKLIEGLRSDGSRERAAKVHG